jgi:flagellar hook-basal body complex protein FliE
MDLRFPPVTSTSYARPSTGVQKPATPAAGTKEAGFSGALKGALSNVSEMQNDATRLSREVQLENPKVSLEETMVAIQKAQIGFQATMHVRNRMVQAYSDIMNMQV